MRVYTVIPISKGIPKETLTYFGSDDISIGALVSIPLRKKTIHAIVIDGQEVSEHKSELKKSDYSLKKITKVVQSDFLSPSFLSASQRTAEYFATSTGSILQHTLPKLVLENAALISKNKKVASKVPSPIKKETSVIQDVEDDRFSHYKGFIRGEFARGSSVYFCVPTAEDLRRAKTLLEKGIEQYTCVLHGGLSKKEFDTALSRISNTEHPVLIIGTVPFISIERVNLGSIILDRENSRSYRTQTRNSIDLRMFVKFLAEAMNVRLVMGDLLLSIETLWKQKNDEYTEISPLKFRELTSAECLLVDMKLPKGEYVETFRILSLELESLIDKSTAENENLFIFCARKGLAPITICGDCGTAVLCQKCNAPVTLYHRASENIFLCNKCGTERGTSERCIHCDSWKLETLGIGAEGVEIEIKKKFPKATVFRMDKDSVSTAKKATEIIEKFRNTPGSVLIGTELALPYLDNSIENIAVASIDALLSLPDFRINEKILYLLLTMRSRANKVFLIQTRSAGSKIFDFALKGNLTDFYRQEIDERQKFRYPPFSLFVKMTIEGTKGFVEKEIDSLAQYFADWNGAPFENMKLSIRGNTLMHILFRFEQTRWPDDSFLKKVRTLPPHITVQVDPESLL